MTFDVNGDGVAIISAAFDAVEAGDIDAFSALCAPGGTIWHNYDKQIRPLTETAAGLRAMHQVVNKVCYADRKYVSVRDGAIAEHVLRGETVSGKSIDIPIVAHVYIQDGRIRHIDEYLDPAQSAAIVEELT